MLKLFTAAVMWMILLNSGIAQSNTALSFSPGTNKAVMVPYAEVLAPTGALTVEAWMYADTLSGAPSIISKTEVGGYALYATSGILRFDVRINGSYRTVSSSATNLLKSWHHVAATTDGRYVRLYVDGTLKDTYDVGAAFPIQYQYNNALIFGAEASSANNIAGSYFSGALDDIRIWSTERSAAEINAAMNSALNGNETGLIGYWNFDEGSGTTANDGTANNNDGTLQNSPAWISSGVSLPVELTSFSVSMRGHSAELRWRTAGEADNFGFDIERKEQTGAGRGTEEWISAGFVEGHGTTNTPQEYSFTDKGLLPGRYSYRLKQIDRNGSFIYSNEIKITAGGASAVFTLWQNYPNPFNPSTEISFTLPAAAHTMLTVFDVTGKAVAEIVNGPTAAGTHSVRFDASRLAGGVYYARLTNGQSIQSIKLLLLK